MKIILLGPPAAGKGTQSKMLTTKYNIEHVSTGDIFRYNISKNTELGIKVKKYMEKGELIPDDLVIDLVKDRVQQDDCKKGFLLDGFPRTLHQAKSFDEFLHDKNLNLDAVVNIVVSDEEIIKRISGRRVCETCEALYNINNERIETCKECGDKLVQRQDDKEEVIKERLKVFHNQTEPLIDYYNSKDMLINVSGLGEVDEISQRISDKLGSLNL